ncbi:MAG: hypothetical protein NTY38_28765 [Acidobacteria bacterium]|nr:hypothetical protein [Acidobacteriota bacterium]
MVGNSSTAAPRSRNFWLNSAAWPRARVTTIPRPNSGRRSYQFIVSRRPTTPPMMMVAGGFILLCSTSPGRVLSVPMTVS